MSMENVSTRSSCRFIRDESIPAARTKMELNTEAPRNSKNQVIALYLYNRRRRLYISIRRKKVRKEEPLCLLTYDGDIIAVLLPPVYPGS